MTHTGLKSYASDMNKVEETRKLIQEHDDLPVKQICKDIGVSPRWFNRFKSGDFKNPGHNTIENLSQWIVAWLKEKSNQAA